MRRVLLSVLATFCVFFVNAQQNAQFSHFMFTKYYYNSAYAGMDPYSQGLLLHRTQWAGYETNVGDPGGSPITQNLSATTPLRFGGKDIKGGLGLNFVNDRIGPNKNTILSLGYSHHLDLSSLGGKLGISAKFGIWNWGIDTDLLRAVDEANDQLINQLGTGVVSQMRPDAGVSLFYKNALDKYYFGFSMDHLLSSQFDWNNAAIDQTNLSPHMYITGGYNVDVSNNLAIKPSVLVQSDFRETNFKLAALGVYDTKVKNEYWLGVSFRQSIVDQSLSAGQTEPSGKSYALDDFVIIAGFGTLKDQELAVSRLKVSYAFDLITSSKDAKSATSHEILLSYVLPSKLETGPPPLKTPRYQHQK